MDMRINEKKWTIHETGSLRFYIDYVASLQGNMGSRDLKIDITRGEILETDVEPKTFIATTPILKKILNYNAIHLLKC